jgi:hypothetical protein
VKLIKIWFGSAIAQITGILFVVTGISLLLYYGTKNNLVPKFEYPDQILVLFLLASAVAIFGVLFSGKKDKDKFSYLLRQPWRNVLIAQMMTIFILNVIFYVASKIYTESDIGLITCSLYNASALFGAIILMIESITLMIQFRVERG